MEGGGRMIWVTFKICNPLPIWHGGTIQIPFIFRASKESCKFNKDHFAHQLKLLSIYLYHLLNLRFFDRIFWFWNHFLGHNHGKSKTRLLVMISREEWFLPSSASTSTEMKDEMALFSINPATQCFFKSKIFGPIFFYQKFL